MVYEATVSTQEFLGSGTVEIVLAVDEEEGKAPVFLWRIRTQSQGGETSPFGIHHHDATLAGKGVQFLVAEFFCRLVLLLFLYLLGLGFCRILFHLSPCRHAHHGEGQHQG